jgi:xylulokinase
VYYDPRIVWETVCAVMREAAAGAEASVAAVGVASMAESGLLVDRRTGEARTMMFPWFDRVASEQAETLCSSSDLERRFYRSGIRPTFKCSLAKLLWLRERALGLLEGAIWLSTADYIAFRLTGEMATDPSLATRTYAFRVDIQAWDTEWLEEVGIDSEIFPRVLPSGAPVGGVRTGLGGLGAGIPVGISGHDHICASFAASALMGGVRSGLAFDSMGTAESLVGVIPKRELGEHEYRSGLSYGCHVAPGFMYWVGGLSTSGGSLEWLRGVLGDPPLAYEQLDALLDDLPQEPGEVFFLPYLAGSGSPHTDTRARGACVGLRREHGRSDLYRAVLEGTAYEMEFIRRAAEEATGTPITRLAAAGGGTRNRRWMQIKADVMGIPLVVLPQAEAVALGAALLAGLGGGVYGSVEEVAEQVGRGEWDTDAPGVYLPDRERQRAYQQRYDAYMALQEPLRAFYQQG